MRHVGDVELQLTGEGTESESLLKWITGHPTVPVRVHLCGSTCPNKVDAEGLVHATKIRQKQRSDEGGWSENLREGRDENAELRREAMALQEKEAKGKERADQKRDDKKTKKKKKEKKKRSSSTGGSSRKKVRSSRKRVNSRKELKDVFGSTGLDPNYKVRRKLVKALKKKLKRKKEESTSGDSSSIDGSGESSDQGSSEDEGIFGDTHKVRVVARRAPGVTIREMQSQLHSLGPGERGGACGGAAILPQPSGPPPFRGGQPRSSDLVLELRPGASGEVANTVDCLAQRLKSLQLTANGGSWRVSQRVEVVPPERGQLTSRAETQAAAKEDKEEQKTRALAKGKEKGKSESSGAGAPWRYGQKGETKGRDKGKGKRSEKEEGKKSS